MQDAGDGPGNIKKNTWKGGNEHVEMDFGIKNHLVGPWRIQLCLLMRKVKNF